MCSTHELFVIRLKPRSAHLDVSEHILGCHTLADISLSSQFLVQRHCMMTPLPNARFAFRCSISCSWRWQIQSTSFQNSEHCTTVRFCLPFTRRITARQMSRILRESVPIIMRAIAASFIDSYRLLIIAKDKRQAGATRGKYIFIRVTVGMKKSLSFVRCQVRESSTSSIMDHRPSISLLLLLYPQSMKLRLHNSIPHTPHPQLKHQIRAQNSHHKLKVQVQELLSFTRFEPREQLFRDCCKISA